MSFNYISDWRPLPEAAAMLGCSVSTLWRLRAAGVLGRGVHWHRVGLGRRAPVVVNVSAARLALQIQLSR
jgi:hypothetical protein